MQSAGQQYGTAPPSYPPQAQPGYGMAGGYGSPYPPMGMVSFNPILPARTSRGAASGPQTTTTIALDGKTDEHGRNPGLEYLNNAAKYQMGNNVINAVSDALEFGLQTYVATQAMNHQASIANEYYKTQGTIAGEQRAVAMEQLNVQLEAVHSNERMHRQQTLHEERMMDLEKSLQTRLASISEQGKSDRARIMTMNDVFSRRSYSYGSPGFLPQLS